MGLSDTLFTPPEISETKSTEEWTFLWIWNILCSVLLWLVFLIMSLLLGREKVEVISKSVINILGRWKICPMRQVGALRGIKNWEGSRRENWRWSEWTEIVIERYSQKSAVRQEIYVCFSHLSPSPFLPSHPTLTNYIGIPALFPSLFCNAKLSCWCWRSLQ